MAKVFKSTNSQLRILRDRGMIVRNGSRIKKILETENYYNIINGYKDLFLDKTDTFSEEKYIKNTNFMEVYALYLFDREIRSIFLKYILEIENNIKTVLAYEFSKKYGHDNYLRVENFDTANRARDSKKTKAQKVGEVSQLIVNIQKEIAKQLTKNNPMISHYMLKEGYVPLWVLVNILTLGTISAFYQNLKQEDQNNIGRKFFMHPDEMMSILLVLTVFRNQCAHDGRLYNMKAVKKNGQPNSIKTNQIHRNLAIPFDTGNNPQYGKNDLFAIVIIFKLMLPKSSFNKFFFALKKEISSLEKKLRKVGINVILREMGFPSNWMDIKEIGHSCSLPLTKA